MKMSRYFLVVLVLLIGCNSSEQPKQVIKRNKKGDVVEITNYRKGEIHGDRIYFNELGEIGLLEVYNFGELVFVTTFFKGKKSTEGPMRKGKEHGVWRSFYFTGQVRSEYRMVDGRLEGKLTQYWKNGNIQTLLEESNDQMIIFQYDSMNELVLEGLWIDGGIDTVFYSGKVLDLSDTDMEKVSESRNKSRL